MKKAVVVAAAVLLVGLLTSCDEGDVAEDPLEPAPPATRGAEEPEDGGDPLDNEPDVIADRLEVPWDLAFASDGSIFVTERPGRVRLIRDDELQDEPVAEVGTDATGEGGLLGIALHPEWPDRAWAYLYYTHPGGSNRVSRYEVTDPTGEPSFGEEEVIVGGIPSASNHNGGRIDFGSDGYLYVTTGDAAAPENSADTGSLAGKILRVEPDGTIPDDNPFGDSPVWAYGLRNPQGFTWDPEGRMYVADHGPSGEFGLCCRDELNLVEEGSFQGWPYRSGGEPTGAGEPPEDPIDPVAQSGNDTWAPAGIGYLEVNDEGSVLMANLRGGHLRRFHVAADDPRDIEDQEVALDGEGRLRHATVASDGCLYVLTSNRDGRGDPGDRDDRVLRFCG